MLGVFREVALEDIDRLSLVSQQGANERLVSYQLPSRVDLGVRARTHEDAPSAVSQSRTREHCRYDDLSFVVIVISLLRRRRLLVLGRACPGLSRIGAFRFRRDPRREPVRR